MKVKDVKASINKIRLIVKGIVNPVNPDDIRSVLVELGIVDKFFTQNVFISQSTSLS